ncbi:hypothetical protein [Nesterenkonia rhizosphaerae]|uniref:HTH cro/C1-type domain-containing protein n=1 Tax=Nesterenkonia rhizosphaerae TaxID=1348272 RepID=A0ABP9FTG4_9MICC
MTTPIHDLIESLKGARTYEALAKDCGGTPSPGRIHQMAKSPMKVFPSPESLRGLAKGLGVRPSVVVKACAESLGLIDEEELLGPPLPLPEGVRNLSRSQRNALIAIAQEIVTTNEALRAAQAADAPEATSAA